MTLFFLGGGGVLPLSPSNQLEKHAVDCHSARIRPEVWIMYGTLRSFPFTSSSWNSGGWVGGWDSAMSLIATLPVAVALRLRYALFYIFTCFHLACHISLLLGIFPCYQCSLKCCGIFPSHTSPSLDTPATLLGNQSFFPSLISTHYVYEFVLFSPRLPHTKLLYILLWV